MNPMNSLISNKSIWKQLKRGFTYPIVWCVLIPWLVLCTYLLLIKAPTYEGVSTLFFNEQMGVMPENKWFSLLRQKQQTTTSVSPNLVHLMQKYARSKDMANKIESALGLKEHYQNPNVDFFSRLTANASDRAFLEYYRKKIDVAVDRNTNELIIKVRSFSPQMTKKLTRLIEHNLLNFYNHMNNQLVEKQRVVAVHALKSATNKLFKQEQLQRIAHQGDSKSPSFRLQIEKEKFQFKITQKEYEAAYEAYMMWQLTTEKNTPVVTTGFSEIEEVSYPRVPYDLISIFSILLIVYLLIKMMYIIILEHTE